MSVIGTTWALKPISRERGRRVVIWSVLLMLLLGAVVSLLLMHSVEYCGEIGDRRQHEEEAADGGASYGSRWYQKEEGECEAEEEKWEKIDRITNPAPAVLTPDRLIAIATLRVNQTSAYITLFFGVLGVIGILLATVPVRVRADEQSSPQILIRALRRSRGLRVSVRDRGGRGLRRVNLTVGEDEATALNVVLPPVPAGGMALVSIVRTFTMPPNFVAISIEGRLAGQGRYVEFLTFGAASKRRGYKLRSRVASLKRKRRSNKKHCLDLSIGVNI